MQIGYTVLTSIMIIIITQLYNSLDFLELRCFPAARQISLYFLNNVDATTLAKNLTTFFVTMFFLLLQ